MRFRGDMQSKWGFSDGDAVPEGIEVYLRTVNRLAALRERLISEADQ